LPPKIFAAADLLFKNPEEQILRPDNEPAFCPSGYLLSADPLSIRRQALTPLLQLDESAANQSIEKNSRLQAESTRQMRSCKLLPGMLTRLWLVKTDGCLDWRD
jgi:hypothetical protein